MFERFCWALAAAAAAAVAVAGWVRPPEARNPDKDLMTLTPFVSHDVGQFFQVRGFELAAITVPSLDNVKQPTRAAAKVIVDFDQSAATSYQDLPPIPMRAVLSYGWHVIRIEPYGMRKQPGA